MRIRAGPRGRTLKTKDFSSSAELPGSDHSESNHPEDLSEVMDFSSYDLRTTVRLIVLSGESRRIDVKKGSREGAIYIREGEIFRAVAGTLHGDEAFFEILSWKNETHSDSLSTEDMGNNVRIPTTVLVDLLKGRSTSTDRD